MIQYLKTALALYAKVLPVAKSIVVGLGVLAGSLTVALQDGKLDTGEIVNVVLAVLAALGVSYAVPNKPVTPGK